MNTIMGMTVMMMVFSDDDGVDDYVGDGDDNKDDGDNEMMVIR